MSCGCVFFFWACVLFVFIPVLALGIKQKSWSLKLLGGIPVVFVILLISSFLILIPLSKNSKFVMRMAFGKLPENHIQVLEHDYQYSTDFEGIYLKLKVSNEDFEKLIDIGFQKADESRMDPAAWDSPEWFKSVVAETNEHYIMSPFNKGYANSEACLSYNKKNNIAYFYCYGVD